MKFLYFSKQSCLTEIVQSCTAHNRINKQILPEKATDQAIALKGRYYYYRTLFPMHLLTRALNLQNLQHISVEKDSRSNTFQWFYLPKNWLLLAIKVPRPTYLSRKTFLWLNVLAWQNTTPTLFYSTWSKQSVLPGCHPSISNGMTQIPAKSRLMFHYIYYEYRRIMLLQTLGSFHNQTLKFAETPFQENWTLISMDSLVKNCSFLWKIDHFTKLFNFIFGPMHFCDLKSSHAQLTVI